MTPEQRHDASRIVHDACLRSGVGYDFLHCNERPNGWAYIAIVNPDSRKPIDGRVRRQLREFNVEVGYEYR